MSDTISGIYQQLSLATKAGRAKSGAFMAEKMIKAGRVALVIAARDASDNTKKHFSDICAYRDIPIRIFGDGESLGRYCGGKESRMVICITDDGFANSLLDKIDSMEVV